MAAQPEWLASAQLEHYVNLFVSEIWMNLGVTKKVVVETHPKILTGLFKSIESLFFFHTCGEANAPFGAYDGRSKIFHRASGI
jgi:hypothetical protein